MSVLAVGFLTVIGLDGCGADRARLGSSPPWLSAPISASVVEPPAAVPPIAPSDASIADPNAPVFDTRKVEPILDDPRLVEVKAAVERKAFRGAAKALAGIIGKTSLPPELEPRWRYQLAVLRLRGGDPQGAITDFELASAVDWPLADYARFMAGDLLARSGQSAEGIARLSAVKGGTALDDAVALALANAHRANRDIDKAIPFWDGYLAKSPRPRGWQSVALRYAKALLNQPSVAHARKAVTVARLVIFESPRGRGVGEARDLEDKALMTIPSTERKPLKNPRVRELVRRARALAEANQSRQALVASKKAIRALSHKTPSLPACDAHIAKGKALDSLKRRSEASDALGVAIKRCEGMPRRVVALFLGGRSALKSGQASLARTRLKMLETEFPTHRFADDARLMRAQAVAHLGDMATFTKLLLTMGSDYPTGDMVEDGLYALAADRIRAGDWAAAVQPLTQAVARQKRGRPYYAEGRPQYFLARAKLKLGKTEEGLVLLEGLIRDFPGAYYMVQAYARLASHDEARAAKAVHGAMAAEPAGHLVIPDHGELHRPGFLRAVELVRQGEAKRALGELDRLGVRKKKAHPSLLWASALLLAKINAHVEAHGVLRSSPDLWREHYPAGVWQPVWEAAYPRPHKAIVDKERKRSPIPEHLAYAIMREESAFSARVVSHANAYGLMQLILPTAKSVAKRLKLKANTTTLRQPAVNIALGCRFLHQLTKKFPDNPVLAIPGYNAGPGAPARWLRERPADDFDLWVERIPYRETRRYTKRVIQSMAAYSMLYDKGMRSAMMRLPIKVAPAAP